MPVETKFENKPSTKTPLDEDTLNNLVDEINDGLDEKPDTGEIAPLDDDETFAADSAIKTASQRATRAYVTAPDGHVVPLLTNNSVIGGAFGPSIKKIYGLRVKIRKTGTLRDLAVFVKAKAGKAIMGLYDTGQANGGNYTKLGADSGEVEPGSNEAWKVILDPNRAVKRGEDYLVALIWSTGTTITIGRGASGAGEAGSLQLPASFIPTSGAASPKLAGITAEQAGFALPEKIKEEDLLPTGNVAYPQILGRIA